MIRGWYAFPLAAAFGILLIVVGMSYEDYGVSWDEPTRHQGGAVALEFYSAAEWDRSMLNPVRNNAHGVIFDLAAAAVSPESGPALWDRRHLLNALTGVAGIAAAGALAWRAFGPGAALWAVILLSVTPSWFGHMFMNPKDIPFASAFLWGLVGIDCFAERLPRPRLTGSLGLALAIGLALGIRLIGVALLVILLAVTAAVLWKHRRGSAESPQRIPLRRVWGHLLLVYIVAHLLMVVGWPWGWGSPFHYLFRALSASKEFTWEGTVLFGGERILATDLPRWAVLRLLAIRLPLPVLVAGIGGLGWTVWSLVRGAGSGKVLRTLLVVTVLLPPLYMALTRPPYYDGIRHVLFMLPALAALGAGGIDALARRLRARFGPTAQAVVVAVVLFSLLPVVRTMWRLHPYAYTYHNALVGGMRGASGQYDLEYWLVSYREAVAGLVDHVESLPGEVDSVRVFAYGQPDSARPYYPESFLPVKHAREADFVIAPLRDDANRFYHGPTVFTVERMGVPFTVVKRQPGSRVGME